VLQQQSLEQLAPVFGLSVVASAGGTGKGVSMQGSEELQVLHESEVLQGFSQSG
jgi:hypothetical protein